MPEEENIENVENPEVLENIEVHGSFYHMLHDISRFRYKYHSFITDRTYTDLLGQTASGLLKDAAKKTEDISEKEEKRLHDHAKNVFAAFCAYFCAQKMQSLMIKYKMPSIEGRAGDVTNTVYGKILARIKSDLEKYGECRYVRNLIKRSANNALIDIFRKEGIYVPMPKDFEDEEKVPNEIAETIIGGAWEAMQNKELADALNAAIKMAYESKVLSKDETKAICYYYGLGNGFSKLPNGEIAKKLHCTQGYATKIRQRGIARLAAFIKNKPEFRGVFC